MTSLVLVPCIASKVSIPVICAGGIANGQGLLAMLALGADGVAMVSVRYDVSNCGLLR